MFENNEPSIFCFVLVAPLRRPKFLNSGTAHTHSDPDKPPTLNIIHKTIFIGGRARSFLYISTPEDDVGNFFRPIARATGRSGKFEARIWNQRAIPRLMSYRTPPLGIIVEIQFRLV